MTLMCEYLPLYLDHILILIILESSPNLSYVLTPEHLPQLEADGLANPQSQA